jgi:hypothetical protein
MTFYRARQRGGQGYHALDHHSAPVSGEWFADGLTVQLVGELVNEPQRQQPETIFARHRDALRARAAAAPHIWKPVSDHNGLFRIGFVRSLVGLADNSVAEVRLGEQRSIESTAEVAAHHPIKLRLFANPSRSLANILARAQHEDWAMADILALSTEQFFREQSSVVPQSLDRDYNWLASLTEARSLLGDDPLASFMPIFEHHLKAVAIEMVAPAMAGFVSWLTPNGIVACNGLQRVALNWSGLSLLRAETYFDRRHSGAPDLLERCLTRITTGQSEGGWSQFERPNPQGGDRNWFGVSVQARLTAGIEQVIYAKTRNSVRCETRYQRRLRNSLGDPQLSSLTEWVLAVRDNAMERLRWGSIQRLIEPVRGPNLDDVAGFVSALCGSIGSDTAGPQTIRLMFATGGIDDTVPLRVRRRLLQAGIVEDCQLRRRARPNQPRRFGLTSRYGAIVALVQASADGASFSGLTNNAP